MNIEITSVNIAFNNGLPNGVNVNFFAHQDVNQNINLNGYIPLSMEEYSTVASEVDDLKEMVKGKVVVAIIGEVEDK